MVKSDEVGKTTARQAKKALPPSKSAPARGKGTRATKKANLKSEKANVRPTVKVSSVAPVVIREAKEPPEGLPKKYYLKSTFNTHDIMHSPVEKTLKMLDKILQGERLFTM